MRYALKLCVLLASGLLAIHGSSSGANEFSVYGAKGPLITIPWKTDPRQLRFVQLPENRPPAAASLPASELQLLPWHAPGPARGGSDGLVAGQDGRAPRMVCEEAIHWASAIQGYVKSKLYLTSFQKQVWQEFELAAEPAIDQQRELCRQLPSTATGHMEVFEQQALGEKILAIRADYLRRTQDMRRTLLGSLSPEQRAILNTPPLSTVETFR